MLSEVLNDSFFSSSTQRIIRRVLEAFNLYPLNKDGREVYSSTECHMAIERNKAALEGLDKSKTLTLIKHLSDKHGMITAKTLYETFLSRYRNSAASQLRKLDALYFRLVGNAVWNVPAAALEARYEDTPPLSGPIVAYTFFRIAAAIFPLDIQAIFSAAAIEHAQHHKLPLNQHITRILESLSDLEPSEVTHEFRQQLQASTADQLLVWNHQGVEGVDKLALHFLGELVQWLSTCAPTSFDKLHVKEYAALALPVPWFMRVLCEWSHATLSYDELVDLYWNWRNMRRNLSAEVEQAGGSSQSLRFKLPYIVHLGQRLENEVLRGNWKLQASASASKNTPVVRYLELINDSQSTLDDGNKKLLGLAVGALMKDRIYLSKGYVLSVLDEDPKNERALELLSLIYGILGDTQKAHQTWYSLMKQTLKSNWRHSYHSMIEDAIFHVDAPNVSLARKRSRSSEEANSEGPKRCKRGEVAFKSGPLSNETDDSRQIMSDLWLA